MSPIVHLVRHAQGVHNLSVKNHQILDPSLTRHGEEQCRHLSRVFPYHNKIELLCSSPLVRCLQTTMLGFDEEVRRGLRIIALPDAQETADIPCDTGKDPEDLRQVVEGKPVDLSLVQPGWNSKKGRYSHEPDAIVARARDLRNWLRARPEREIVLVTHGGYLHWLTEDWDKTQKAPGQTGWANAEFRSYEFKDDDNASMVETARSRRLRYGSEKPLSETEQLELSFSGVGSPAAAASAGRAKPNGSFTVKARVSEDDPQGQDGDDEAAKEGDGKKARQDRDWVGSLF